MIGYDVGIIFFEILFYKFKEFDLFLLDNDIYKVFCYLSI